MTHLPCIHVTTAHIGEGGIVAKSYEIIHNHFAQRVRSVMRWARVNCNIKFSGIFTKT